MKKGEKEEGRKEGGEGRGGVGVGRGRGGGEGREGDWRGRRME